MASINKVDILGVKIDTSSKESILREIQIYIKNKKKFFVVTPNPEQVMLAQSDPVFREIINNADISLPDGIGLLAAYKFLSLPRSGRLRTFLQGLWAGFCVLGNRTWLESDFKVIKGREFFLDLVKLANKKGWRMYLLGGEGKEAENTLRVLAGSYKNITLQENSGPHLTTTGNPKNVADSKKEKEAIAEINKLSPQLLIVGFGAPKQEKWVYQNLRNLKVGGVMVVGGTFKFVSGGYKLPPNLIGILGLEWLWRLATGSQKGRRIVQAFPEFPWRVFVHKLHQ